MILGLWTTPYIISLIGKEDFGRFRAMQELQGYLGILFIGIYGGLIILLNQINSKNNISEQVQTDIYRIYAQGMRRYLGIGIVTFLAGCVLTWPASKVLNAPLGDFFSATQIAVTYFSLLACNFMLFGQVFQADLDSRMRNDLVSIGFFIQSVVTIGTTIIFATWGYGLVSNAIGVFLGYLSSSLFFIIKTKVNYKKLFNALTDQTTQDDRFSSGLNTLSKTSALNDLASRIALFSDNIVISALMGPAVVTSYFLSQRLPSLLLNNLTMLGGSVWAGMGDLYHSGDSSQRLADNVLRLTRIQSLMGISALVPALLFNHEFVTIWVGKEFYLGELISIFACVNVFIQSLLSLWGWLFVSFGRPNLITQWIWLQAIINIVVSISATYYWGVLGPLIGTFCSYLCVSVWKVPQLISNNLNISLFKIHRAWLESIIFGLVLYLGLLQFRDIVIIKSFFQLLLVLSVVGTAVGLLGFFIVLRTSDRVVVYNMIRKIRHRG